MSPNLGDPNLYNISPGNFGAINQFAAPQSSSPNYSAFGQALAGLAKFKKKPVSDVDPSVEYTNKAGFGFSDLAGSPGMGMGVSHGGAEDYTSAPALNIKMPGSMVESSDKEEKKNLKELSIDSANIENFIKNIKGYKYEYKHPDNIGQDHEVHFSPMYQDLEKSSIGKSMLERGPEGEKLVNYAKGFGAILAVQANLNERLSKLEKGK